MAEERYTFEEWLQLVCSSCRKAKADPGYKTCYSCRNRVARAKGREKAPQPEAPEPRITQAGLEKSYIEQMLADLGIQEGEPNETESP